MGKSKNEFKLSEDGTYWIGITNNGTSFIFNGCNSGKIMNVTWYISIDGFPMGLLDKKRISLYHMVLHKPKKGNVIDHINNNKLDNRVENLREIPKGENNKNKKTTNIYGLVGLTKFGEKFSTRICIKGIAISSTHKIYEEAYIDNLIIQKEYGYSHNQDKFYLLDNLPECRILEVINLIDKKIENYKNKNTEYKPTKSNKYELSDDESFYWVIDSKGNKFKISIESLEFVQLGLWSVGKYRNKKYVSGRYVNHNGKILIHRYIMGLEGDIYSEYHIDHINGDELDNRLENLVITNNDGNMVNKKGKGYSYKAKEEMYCVGYGRYSELVGEIKQPSFKCEQEAINEVARRRKLLMENRLEFKSKEELDEYIACLKIN